MRCPPAPAHALQAAVRLTTPAAVQSGCRAAVDRRDVELDAYLAEYVRVGWRRRLGEHGTIVVRGS